MLKVQKQTIPHNKDKHLKTSVRHLQIFAMSVDQTKQLNDVVIEPYYTRIICVCVSNVFYIFTKNVSVLFFWTNFYTIDTNFNENGRSLI